MCISLAMLCMLIGRSGDLTATQNQQSVKMLFEEQPVVGVSELDRLSMFPEDASKYRIGPELFSSAQIPERKISQSSHGSQPRQKDFNLKKIYQIERVNEFEIYLPNTPNGGFPEVRPPAPKSIRPQRC